ncbi:hypothetical protein COW36_09925 [bacterium (Candidatus Blackallbacteria) CG17_big_fil_post_rev_8_21_14_2_50_48_46]|uniref:Uncharacterized protein n=1 Tax=bacterium (Candidatus Blackallbacteria) CG17_big_fil_post_rev_8_21_14_2_50_48_46 TaxID=2014261 RepID=A0A2M7G5C9_9BACT|nr:MAG: hypothetical protein COW64_26055 [bacterium (Candidatus Blackallbacteria) CG18_big_fil_WC_8_21_14_2_50_49_26]PIW17164.1 MAG: hypothetical protein COW36_09925 [bacterium (Candidatus Blackallbacteria) CG17_big_fil_post_rev_8_21_14_2_50_48_46]PIW44490.1 MAG: hypothetical protein COW20_24030 [bacterium (Candidatus Blackallbacteria) CG13_big_fil_rev_8_21_14_2_50_49_14]
MQIGPKSPQNPQPAKQSFQVGSYDEGALDLADKVTVERKQTFKTRAEAVAFAKANPGSEMVVERVKPGQGLGYDVYQVTIHDKGQKLGSLKDMQNLQLFDKPVNQIQKETGLHSQRAFFVTENGETSPNLYPQKFDRTHYDKLRATLGLQDSKQWFKLVDKYMTAPSPEDSLPPISSKELADLKSHLNPGDIIMTGNNGSFIHGIIYVGQDKELQAQLEKKWKMAPGSLNGEGLILHSLAADHGAEIEINGKKQHQPPGGTGVIIDTIERYNARNPRDVMIAVEVKGSTEADRKAVIAEGKKMVGKGYDNGFNTFDDRDIYCTEFIYKSWLASPDAAPEFATQLHPLIPQTSAPVSGWLYDKVSDKKQQEMKDDGYLYQEMVMTDGIITSPSVHLKWASQNADQSEFFKKHERWAEGMAGKISPDYKALLQENVPEQAARSNELLGQIRTASARTRQQLAAPEAPAKPVVPAPPQKPSH